MDENEIGRIVVDAAVALHRELGPGLLESVYEAVLARELTDRRLKVERQISMPIVWRGVRFDEGFRADIIVEGKVIVELKSVESVTNAHKKQLLTYLRLAGLAERAGDQFAGGTVMGGCGIVGVLCVIAAVVVLLVDPPGEQLDDLLHLSR